MMMGAWIYALVALVAVVLAWDILRRQAALKERELGTKDEAADGARTALANRVTTLERDVKELAIRHDLSRPKLSKFQKGA